MFAWQGERFFETIGAHDLQNGAEDFFFVGAHVGGDIIEQCWAHEEPVFMALQFKSAPIDEELCTLFKWPDQIMPVTFSL